MINVADSIVIQCPIEEVFAFLADQTNAPQWQPDLVEVRRITNEPIGVGTQHTIIRKFMGRRLELTNEYLRYELNKEITFIGGGAAHFETTYLTETVPNGTKVTCQMQMQLGNGLLGLAEPLIANSLKRDFASNFRTLKALLENQAVKNPS